MSAFGSFPRGGGSEVRVTRNTFKGVERVDLRLYYVKADGELSPTVRGVSFLPEEVSDLLAALKAAVEVTE